MAAVAASKGWLLSPSEALGQSRCDRNLPRSKQVLCRAFTCSICSPSTCRPGAGLRQLHRDVCTTAFLRKVALSTKPRGVQRRGTGGSALNACAALEALVFDCDGTILESEDLHRRAYNAGFAHFQLRLPGSEDFVEWDEAFYDQLQNKIGGGKPKMRWYFGEKGWPSSTILPEPPQSDDEKAKLIDTLQDWKSSRYQEMIGSGEVPPRPGVLALMDEAFAAGVKVAVCSAATKSSVIFTLKSLLGTDRFERLDCFLAGDDVKQKKPDPTIYKQALKVLNVLPEKCLVVEDSVIGLQAASGADMPCIITYTVSTESQAFSGAAAIYPNLENVKLEDLKKLTASGQVAVG